MNRITQMSLSGWKLTDRIHRLVAVAHTKTKRKVGGEKRHERGGIFICVPRYKSLRLVKSGGVYYVERRISRGDIWHRCLRSFRTRRDAERYARKRYPEEEFQMPGDAFNKKENKKKNK